MYMICARDGVELDLIVEFAADDLYFVDKNGNKTLCCDRTEIENNSYKSLFSSRLHEAIDKAKEEK